MEKRNSKAQIAVIITLVIAAIILFVIVFLNLAKLSNIKTLTSQVADRAGLYLSSQIGSMSHYLKEKVIGDPACRTNWLALVLFLAGIVLMILTLGLAWPLSVFLIGTGLASIGLFSAYASSLPVNKAIYEQFKAMTMYNGIREATLYQALMSLQTDGTLLRPSGNGIFFDDLNKNKVEDKDPPGEPEYNLSDIVAMRNAKETGRFFAWYYQYRRPLVSDDALRHLIASFLADLRDKIKLYDWDAVNWINRMASFVVGPVDVTCSSPSCPSWVYDAENGLVSVLTIDEGNKDNDGWYIPSGFLTDKFDSLCKRLENSYGLSFCGHVFLWWGTKCDSVTAVIADLNILVSRVKELVDLPISLRFQAIDTWLPLFFDTTYTHTAGGSDHDIWDRLTRDEIEIAKWIAELSDIDASIRDTIADVNGDNEYGIGDAVSQCYTEWNCCASDCSKRCCEVPDDCSFEGEYCSACGTATPPVCVNGDLYGEIPDWCPLPDRSADCNKHCPKCSRGPRCPQACNFQGQYWRGGGLTEVGQAIEILEALLTEIGHIKIRIRLFARRVSDLLPRDASLRNGIVYAWTDAGGFSHLVAVKLMNYPEKLPFVTEERAFWVFSICRVLRGGSDNDGTGDLTIITWRYDEDIPTPWWTTRLRKQPLEEQFPKEKLKAIVQDIQDNGLIDSTTSDTHGYLKELLGVDIFSTDPITIPIPTTYAITSSAKAEYGPEKADIKIVETH